MKPLNLDNRPCSPISSNCVIWQGPDIPCIKLCTGDTVSDVVAKLGTELCTIMEQLNVTNYDLSCLNLTGCAPEDFKGLIQLLITKVCELNGIPTNVTKSTNACPDCVVSVAPCFVQGTQTTMQLVDYVQMIANRVCTIIDQITEITNELVVINDTLIDLQIQIDNIPTYTLPSIPAGCILAPGSYPLDQILNALMNDGTLGYCSLLNATGTPGEIINGILTQCILDGDLSLASKAAGDSPVQSFSTYYAGSWVNNASLTASPTVANAIKNIWIAICDIYGYVQNLSLSVEDTNTINLTYAGGVLKADIQDTGWVDLEGFTFYAANVGKPQCRRIGNQIHFRGVVVVPLANPANPANVVTYTNTAYNSVNGCAVFTGPGGCSINTNGSVIFNNDLSIIPSTILNPGTNFDNTYGKGYIIASRQIDLDPNTYGTALSSVLNIGITSDKKLFAAVLKDLEYTSTVQNAAQLGSSHLRYITSNVVAGQKVPDFLSTNTNIHNDPASGVQPLSVDFNTFSYPFDCDAGLETEIGGFVFRLDGLIAYVDPCTTDIKEYVCK